MVPDRRAIRAELVKRALELTRHSADVLDSVRYGLGEVPEFHSVGPDWADYAGWVRNGADRLASVLVRLRAFLDGAVDNGAGLRGFPCGLCRAAFTAECDTCEHNGCGECGYCVIQSGEWSGRGCDYCGRGPARARL